MGLVASLARPGGNITGFTPFEFGFGAKWLEMLKEIAPRVTRAAVLRDLTIGPAQLSAIQAVAPSFGVELSAIGVRDAAEIERTVAEFARSSNAGMIVTASTSAIVHRDLITMLAARHGLPTVYSFRYFLTAGGPISYGANATDQYRRAAGYIDRILKGEKPADLPVQAPTKYELVINLKTRRPSDSPCRIAYSPAPTRSSNDPQAPARPADDARQHAQAGRGSPHRLLPERLLSPSGANRRLGLPRRDLAARVRQAGQVRQVRRQARRCAPEPEREAGLARQLGRAPGLG
jgi:ABC transporter substrate binding protein